MVAGSLLNFLKNVYVNKQKIILESGNQGSRLEFKFIFTIYRLSLNFPKVYIFKTSAPAKGDNYSAG